MPESTTPLRSMADAVVSRLRSSFAFGRRCIPAGGVARRLHISDMLAPLALPAGRLVALGATTNFGDATLESFWHRGRRVERAGCVIGVLLLASGLIHIGILVIGGGSWEGPQ